MEGANYFILVLAIIFFLTVTTSSIASRFGAPLLLAFLALGMLAGEEGIGGVVFNNYPVAYLISSLALAVILFDGGLRTHISSVRLALKPALSLASIGVFISALITGLSAAWLLDLHWTQGVLLGSIVGSTDAAAVFSLLNNQGVQLKRRVAATLEIESGSNDPMAIFMTVAMVTALSSGQGLQYDSMLILFVQQMGLGVVGGLLGGRLLAALINRMHLATGLYPLLALAGGLCIFSFTAEAGGSGFLAIYLAGIVMGNRRLKHSISILNVHDGFAWLGQMTLFLILGLLVKPSNLWPLAPQALAIAGVLIFVARPAAVFIGLAHVRLPWREKIFISWVGLRGAVPVVLAMFPLLGGLPNAGLYFNLAFFVVLISLILQGWTIAPAARWLKLEVPPSPEPFQSVDIGHPDGSALQLLVYRIAADSSAIGHTGDTLPLPEGVRVVAVCRDHRFLPSPGLNLCRENDLIYLLADPDHEATLSKLFFADPEYNLDAQQRFFGLFTVSGTARLNDLSLLYQVDVPEDERDTPLADYLAAHLPKPDIGDRVQLGRLILIVKAVNDGRVTEAGVSFAPTMPS